MASSKDVLKKLFKRYDKNCLQLGQRMVQSLKQEIRKGINENQLLTKIIIDSETRNDPQFMDYDDKSKESSLAPLFDAIQQEEYFHIQFIHIWRFRTDLEDIKSLEQSHLDNIKPTFCRSLAYCPTLIILNLDHNPITNEGCRDLWEVMKTTKCLKILSLNYCSLTWKSGAYLGSLVAGTSIRSLHLNGNELLSIGALEIIHHCVKQVEFEMKKKKLQEGKMEGMKERIAQALSKHGKKQIQQTPPPPGPWITELHLADNGLNTFIQAEIMRSVKERLCKQGDLHSHYHNNTLNNYPHLGALKPVDLLMEDNPSDEISKKEFDINSVTSEKIFIVFLKRTAKLIAHSDTLEELNLASNNIGYLGDLIIKEAMDIRTRNHLPSMKLYLTHRTLPEVVASISG